MRNSMKTATNHTGAKMALKDVKSMVQATDEFPPDINGDIHIIEKHRRESITHAPSIGSVPLPEKSAKKETKVNGKISELFIDKLGERLAFERSGVRLYEAAIAKALAYKNESIVEELKRICRKEAEHLELLIKAVKKLGADPTAVTPAADISGVIGMGFQKVVSDPRTTMAQSLEALLSAELIDNTAWELLIELAKKNGNEEVVKPFQEALEEEREHLKKIKHMLKQSLL